MKNVLSKKFSGKKTKIVATIGPSSESEKVLRQLIKEGMNVARLNFSHNDHAWHKKTLNLIRKISKELNVPIGIIADLQGPRIRVGNTKEFEVKKGEEIYINESKNKLSKNLIIDQTEIKASFKKGERILVEDGMIAFKISNVSGDKVRAKVTNGGIIRPQKGVNLPDTKIIGGVLTKKDIKDLKFSLKNKVDFVALSFVSNEKEIQNLRSKIKRIYGAKKVIPQIISKVERKEAIKNIKKIVDESDAVMVARGDLGIEMPESKVVLYQKEIISRCLRAGKPVIVATQMLESMMKNPIPTRAEVSDVSNAVIDHTDAVMLSGETANGEYPVETVKMMREIIEKTEKSPFDDLEHGFLGDAKSSVSAAVAQSAHELLKDSESKAIVIASISGFTARMISRHRPEQKVYVMTNQEKTYNQLALVWGVETSMLPFCKNLEELIDKSIKTLKKDKLIIKGDKVVIVTGRPHVEKEHMSLVKVEIVK